MGDPGLFQNIPDIPSLLPECCADGELAAAVVCATGGLDAIIDLEQNYRLEPGTYSCGGEDFVYGAVDGGVDTLDFRKGPQAVGHIQQLLSGGQRFGPWPSIA